MIFGSKILEKFQSKYSGELVVKKEFLDIYVSTGILTQSGGLIKDIWDPTLKKIKPLKNKSWLILGLATGTVAKIISQKYQPLKIIGVEIDPVMLDIGRKYFKLDEIPNLEIVNHDAREYVSDLEFDYILVDLYLGDQPPKFLYSEKFLNKLNKLGKLVIINHLFYDQQKKEMAEKLIESLKKYFKDIRLSRVITNVMIICS